MGTRGPVDPWAAVDDLDGRKHYRTLGLQKDATHQDIKKVGAVPAA